MLSLIEIESIEKIVSEHLQTPDLREWQKRLAYEVVSIIHWQDQAQLAVKITEFLFWKTTPLPSPPLPGEGMSRIEILKKLNHEELLIFQKSIWGFHYTSENLFESIVKSELAPSNGEARKSVQSWAISINSEKISEFDYDFAANFINDSFILIQKGKKNFRLILK
jgi:tyrosyl-tRNA synthetase